MAFEQFVDGAMSLGVAIAIAGALASEDGEAELRDLWNSLEHDEHGRVPIDDWAAVLQLHPELLAHYTGLDARISPRFEAFFITGPANWTGLHNGRALIEQFWPEAASNIASHFDGARDSLISSQKAARMMGYTPQFTLAQTMGEQ